ncbi:MAG: phosphoribosylanthranilate isomerase [Candidatus Bathyarchaeota archaeon]|nr:MAG: phosphoribosylanthranilate isomerase [Candidatus Bathyarchaeota archaeon]
MRTVRIKVCGITREENLKIAVSAGVEAIGFIVGVPSSPRNLTVEEVKRLMHKIPIFIDRVAVLVLDDIDQSIEICETLHPSAIQVHGGSPSLVARFHREMEGIPMIRAVDAKSGDATNNAQEAARLFDAVLLDSLNEKKLGGTGSVHDWNVSRDIAEMIQPKPLILAGGLTPENVKEAVSIVKPYAVDVSSGIEASPGVKDPRKIIEFVERAKEVSL